MSKFKSGSSLSAIVFPEMVVGAGENITSGNWRESLPVFRLSRFGVHLVSIFDGNQIDFSEMERIDRKRERVRIYWVLELSSLPSMTSLLRLDPNPCLSANSSKLSGRISNTTHPS